MEQAYRGRAGSLSAGSGCSYAVGREIDLPRVAGSVTECQEGDDGTWQR